MIVRPGELWVLDITNDLVFILAVESEFFYKFNSDGESDKITIYVVKVLHQNGDVGWWSQNFLSYKVS